MERAIIRKLITIVEEVYLEADHLINPPSRRVAAVAVIKNPHAGQYTENLEKLMAIGEELGSILGDKCLRALGGDTEAVQSYGKAALVGENGELEHAAAILHPRFGEPLRAAIGKGKALIPSNKKCGGMGHPFDIPLGHTDAAYVRSHFDGMEVRVNDAPRADEILVAVALGNSGRPLPRVGGLTHNEAKGTDGLN